MSNDKIRLFSNKDDNINGLIPRTHDELKLLALMQHYKCIPLKDSVIIKPENKGSN